MASWAIEAFGPELLTKDGKQKTADVLAGKNRVGVYFSAHWVRIFMFDFYCCRKH